ncbi:MAG: polysaccharide biosynthesis C-terminal domain-containing protein, partial [Clostridia bacterium]|nr:polysaccharide biosynthesis C-terminal domain-containing protein [Clostridia bacterium]
LPACAFLAFFALPVSRLLFFQLSMQEVALSAKLLRLSSLQIPLLSIVQTGNAVLISQGKARRSAFALGISCLVEVFLSFFLLLRGIGIFSLPISAIVGYFVATFFNLVYSMKGKTTGKARKRFALQTAAQAFAAFFSAAAGKAASAFLKSPFSICFWVFQLRQAYIYYCTPQFSFAKNLCCVNCKRDKP